jgi:hypothetical protein
MSTLDPKAFWLQLNEAERQRKEREHTTREVKVRPQYRVAGNDEPEPDRALAEMFAGPVPFEVKP